MEYFNIMLYVHVNLFSNASIVMSSCDLNFDEDEFSLESAGTEFESFHFTSCNSAVNLAFSAFL